ncbi:hypothetical protein [Streptomyces sp. NPDC046984]|uniref:hypothetical protein n=1 Tax=unclassified Streptomyces TaxID=2593676 RepID=UPI0033C3A007
MSRARTALAVLVQALGEGERTLNLVAERTADTFVRAEADLSVGSDPLRLAVLDERALLVFVLEGSTVRSAVLVATTAAAPHPVRAAGPCRAGGCAPWTRPSSGRPSSPALRSPP